MITGAHVVVYSKDPEADRTFFKDVLKFPSVDAGHGWLIFAMPGAEVAFHPYREEQPARDVLHVRRLEGDDGITEEEKSRLRCGARRTLGKHHEAEAAGQRRGWPLPA